MVGDEMIILEDTRQQENRHNPKHNYFRSVGVQWNRTALYCGDYTLPANQGVCIDTKKDIGELIGDIDVKKMSKNDIRIEIGTIRIDNWFSDEFMDEIYHIITDDDEGRFVEKEINDFCYKNGLSESVISDFQKLYVKRHGFFHRGLKRAQYSGIKLIVLVENKDNIVDINSLLSWVNPRLKIMVNSNEIIGYYNNGRPKYKKVQKYPKAKTGEVLAKALLTMQQKYGVEFQFCSPAQSGKRILELLGVNI
jgi:hypothetical protein